MSTNTISAEITQALEEIKKASQQKPDISIQELEILFLASLLEEE